MKNDTDEKQTLEQELHTSSHFEFPDVLRILFADLDASALCFGYPACPPQSSRTGPFSLRNRRYPGKAFLRLRPGFLRPQDDIHRFIAYLRPDFQHLRFCFHCDDYPHDQVCPRIDLGFATTSNTTIAGDIIPAEKRGEGFGLFGVTTTAGMALGPPVGTFILQHSGYNTMFLAGAAISIISMILAAFIRYPSYTPLPENRQFKWKNLFEAGTVVPSVNLTIIGLSYGGLISFIALYGKETGIPNPSGFFLVFALGIISSRFSAGKAVDRNGPRMVIMVCLLLLIIGYPLLALLQNAWGYYISALVLGFGNGVVWPTFQAMVNNTVPANRRGAANSTLFIAMDLGMGLGMIIAGQISQHYSISAAFLCCSSYCAAGLALFRLFTLKHYLKRRLLVLLNRE